MSRNSFGLAEAVIMEHTDTSASRGMADLHFESAVDGLYVMDVAADVFVKVNPALCRILGYTREQLVEASPPMQTSSLIHDEDREAVKAQRASARRAGDSGVSRFRVVRRDGEVRHLEVSFTTAAHAGRLLRMGTVRDVSEQVQLEQKLRAESEFNRELTLGAQRAARDAERKTQEVAEANKRLTALADVLRAIPLLTKRLLEIEQLDDVFKEAALTMVNDAQFSSCMVLLQNNLNELEIKYANPFRVTAKLDPDSNPVYQAVLRGTQELAVDNLGIHVSPMRSGNRVRGLLQVGLPRALQQFYAGSKQIQDSIRDVVVTIADFLGVVVQNHENLERIKQQSRQDKLTGLFNRRVFEEQLVIEFRRALRYDRDLSLMIMDLDNFKRVNDTWGHQTGDRVLEEVGKLLRDSFRDLDTVCRYGGEEICVIMPETVGEAARVKAEQIRRKISELEVPLIESPDKKIQVTASIGVACMTKDTPNEHTLVRVADRALYYCKQHGRNQVRLGGVGDDAA